jgi:predicted aldo/keto reductase-like oxidoreductase
MQFNDLYCLARPEVHTLSLGAANPGDFDEHISALAHYEQRETRVASIAATLNGFLEAEHGAAWMRDWQRGIPPYWEIPGEVNIHEILRLWTYGEGLHLREWAKMRYNLLGNAGHWFPGRMAETVDATALAPLLTGSPFRDTIPEILRRAHAAYHSTPKKRLSQGGD